MYNGAAAAGAQFQKMMTVLDNRDQRNRFLLELIATSLDARQVENFVDQTEQMHARVMNIGRIFPVSRNRMRAEYLSLHDLGETKNSVKRRAQFVTHLGKESRLGDVRGLGAPTRFVGDRLRLFQFSDYCVF